VVSRVGTNYSVYLVPVWDSAKSGLGYAINRPLSYFVKSVNVNAGESYRDVKVSSPPMLDKRVGAVIVVGGWESQPQGEGRQRVDSCKIN
jgi:hypothetical protein